jgi:hypothetical protein
MADVTWHPVALNQLEAILLYLSRMNAIREGVENADPGKLIPHDEVTREMREWPEETGRSAGETIAPRFDAATWEASDDARL